MKMREETAARWSSGKVGGGGVACLGLTVWSYQIVTKTTMWWAQFTAEARRPAHNKTRQIRKG